jgi:hypothetical protein
MAKTILSENSDVVLSSQHDLSPADIVQDCLEKIKALLLICTQGFDMSRLPMGSQQQYLTLLADLLELAMGHLMLYQNELDEIEE